MCKLFLKMLEYEILFYYICVFICKNIGNMLNIFFVNLISCIFFSKNTIIIFVTLKYCMILFNFADKLKIIDITYNHLFLTSKKIIHLINLFLLLNYFYLQ